jgi:peptidoglycan/xylan/chitin deacetylase (PgdA/CDA1 family)
VPPHERINIAELQARRRERARQRELRARRRRVAAIAALVAVIAVGLAVVLGTLGSGSNTKHPALAKLSSTTKKPAAGHSRTAAAPRATGVPGTASVPILMYHVINPPPSGAPFPGLYVPSDEFAGQMQALKAAGWHAVTLNQLMAYWTKGVPLGPGKPIVLSFDNGYQSQYTNALPVLKQLGWVGDENIQLSGLPPDQGGITEPQVKGLLDAGWELDTQGISHADLITLDAAQLTYQVDSARKTLQRLYHVPVNWFCYPSGHYNDTVVSAVRAAGFVGSTTVVPGWAGPRSDMYRLPRLRVLGGTSPSELLSQIATAQSSGPPPDSYSGA